MTGHVLDSTSATWSGVYSPIRSVDVTLSCMETLMFPVEGQALRPLKYVDKLSRISPGRGPEETPPRPLRKGVLGPQFQDVRGRSESSSTSRRAGTAARRVTPSRSPVPS